LLLGGKLLRRTGKLLCLTRLLLVFRGSTLRRRSPHSVVHRRAWLHRLVRLRLLSYENRTKEQRNTSETGDGDVSGHRDLCYSKGKQPLQQTDARLYENG
jgi:hypothetical protein